MQSRLSKNHRLVYDIFREQGIGTHLAMSDLYELARRRQPAIGFTTVYRAITRLRDMGLVSEIVLPGADSAFYEPAGPAHAHFRCSHCGMVADVPYDVPSSITSGLASRLGAEIDAIAVTLQGRCRSCVTRKIEEH